MLLGETILRTQFGRLATLRAFLSLPAFRDGYRPTAKRLANLYLSRWEHMRCRTRLRSLPHILSFEPVNACNLRCPFCFTGAGGLGRPRGIMSMGLFRALMDELGDYLFLVKAYNWGEPLLCPHLVEMIGIASARGIATVVNTNLGLSLDDAAVERLVGSGVTELVVSIDGSTQALYERYRVRGDLGRVLANCRRLVEIRHRLGSALPHLTVEFHPFPWNADDAPRVLALADELGMELRVFKGCMPGADWDVERRFAHCGDPAALPCPFLWTTAVVAADGGVAPCNGTFYSGDDLGRLDPDDLRRRSFRAIWNGDGFRAARRFFRRREGTEAERRQVCFDCPNTLLWERFQAHLAREGHPYGFVPGIDSNDVWNYFWRRRPERALRRHAG